MPLVEPGKTTVNISSIFENYSASRAVDGDVNQTISRCSHTDATCTIKEAWLRVDLKNTYSIKSVKFWYRNDGKHLTVFTDFEDMTRHLDVSRKFKKDVGITRSTDRK